MPQADCTVRGIFDSHCHYDDAAFDSDRDSLLDHLFSGDSSVEYLMHACTDLDSAEFGLHMAERFERYYTSVGIHPETLDKEYGKYADGLPAGYIERLRELALHPKVKAIGEIGLDHHYEGYDSEAQRELFEAQLVLAKQLDLPVIMHCRDATEDFLRLMEKHRPRGVVHCFSGSAETAEQLLKLGLYIGFTGALTFKNAKKAKRAFGVVPTDRLLFETDCPYMAPPPFRGKRCYSEMIAYVAAEGERLSGIPAQQLTDITNMNAKKLFGI
ncbi:MAG: TatD family hydrolase [Ruminococcus sp.]|nr:TatD family hydrolase [Ruminococcus sp.]